MIRGTFSISSGWWDLLHTGSASRKIILIKSETLWSKINIAKLKECLHLHLSSEARIITDHWVSSYFLSNLGVCASWCPKQSYTPSIKSVPFSIFLKLYVPTMAHQDPRKQAPVTLFGKVFPHEFTPSWPTDVQMSKQTVSHLKNATKAF